MIALRDHGTGFGPATPGRSQFQRSERQRGLAFPRMPGRRGKAGRRQIVAQGIILGQLARSFGRRFVAELGLESSERNSNLPGRDARNDSVYLGGTWKF